MKSNIEIKRKYKPVTNREYRIIEEKHTHKGQSSEETEVGNQGKQNLTELNQRSDDMYQLKSTEHKVENKSDLPRPSDLGTPTTMKQQKQVQPISVAFSQM